MTLKRTPLKRGLKQLKRSGFKTKTALAPKKRSKSTTAPKKPKPKTQAQLKKQLDSFFSVYIRRKYSNSDGDVVCFTCGKVFAWQHIQNGHFISRAYLSTRWNINNCRPQCTGCNIFGNGKPLDFEEALKKELGNDFVEKMKASRHQMMKVDRIWYKEQIEYYKSLVEKL